MDMFASHSCMLDRSTRRYGAGRAGKMPRKVNRRDLSRTVYRCEAEWQLAQGGHRGPARARARDSLAPCRISGGGPRGRGC